MLTHCELTDEQPTTRTKFRRTTVRYGAFITSDAYEALVASSAIESHFHGSPCLDRRLCLSGLITETVISMSANGPVIYFTLMADRDTYEDRRRIAETIEAFCDEAIAEHKALQTPENLGAAREYIATLAEMDGNGTFAREVRAGCWDHRQDLQIALRRLASK